MTSIGTNYCVFVTRLHKSRWSLKGKFTRSYDSKYRFMTCLLWAIEVRWVIDIGTDYCVFLFVHTNRGGPKSAGSLIVTIVGTAS